MPHATINRLLHQLEEAGFPRCQLDHTDYPGLFQKELLRGTRAACETAYALGADTRFFIPCFGHLRLAPDAVYIGFEFTCPVATLKVTLSKVHVRCGSLTLCNSLVQVRTTWEAAILSRSIIRLVHRYHQHEMAKKQHALLLALEKQIRELITLGYCSGIVATPGNEELATQLSDQVMPGSYPDHKEALTKFITIGVTGRLPGIESIVSLQLNFLFNAFASCLKAHSVAVWLEGVPVGRRSCTNGMVSLAALCDEMLPGIPRP